MWLQVFRTVWKGWGLRAAEHIPEGAFVCEYMGELITCSEAETRGREILDGDAYLYDLGTPSPPHHHQGVQG